MLYTYLYEIITKYFLPETLNVWHYADILQYFVVICSALVFWACIGRPFWWLLKYGIFGSSKKNGITKRR